MRLLSIACLLVSSGCIGGQRPIELEPFRDSGFFRDTGAERCETCFSGDDGALAGSRGVTATVGGIEFTHTAQTQFTESEGRFQVIAYAPDPENPDAIDSDTRWEVTDLPLQAGDHDCASPSAIQLFQDGTPSTAVVGACTIRILSINAQAVTGQFLVALQPPDTAPGEDTLFTNDGYFHATAD